jgi:DNA-binding beta-propeller fold protein YncE
VISGATNEITATVGVGENPQALAVNPLTNTIYVTNEGTTNGGGNSVTVINGATNATSTISVQFGNETSGADGISVDPVNDLIYVTNTTYGYVAVINGATGVHKRARAVIVVICQVAFRMKVASRWLVSAMLFLRVGLLLPLDEFLHFGKLVSV